MRIKKYIQRCAFKTVDIQKKKKNEYKKELLFFKVVLIFIPEQRALIRSMGKTTLWTTR